MNKDRLDEFKNDEESEIPPYRPAGFEPAPPMPEDERSLANNFGFNNFIQGQYVCHS